MNFLKVAIIALGYVTINLFIFFFNYALLNSVYSIGPSLHFNVKYYLLTNIFVGVIAGLLAGIALVSVNSRLFRRRSFKFAIGTTLISYVVIFILVTFVATFSNLVREYGLQGITYDTVKITLGHVFDLALLTYFILWGFITLATLFLLQVNDKFGPGMLLKFLAGNYHQPKKEERIFMFMDMRSSTTIAEKIGNEKYFHLLNDLFSDIADTILNNEGEIYQYVGDEIVISWSIKKGVRNANCLRCFTEIQEKLTVLRPIYEQKYKVMPEFKAGLHYGLVMAGEIGVIKKDIIYSGDVLNTTARIQEQCNQYSVDILISTETFNLLSDTNGYELITLGNIELRGKERKIDLNTVRTI
ncbi:adenylate/guanylate cyclase domain-containing protein [Maribacter sp. HTCC2170]|uniref:adenylate/guanylate cyclase domain-containing protein n=1 Tax=Maribacter sp. (strain HTCC2170 / KCCM 42371) TaxID=313603 RepID=UPI001ED8E1CF|nr:adenylate/guanylate cyclase domain-containing protein [Maribacter sp. HTCC2170]